MMTQHIQSTVVGEGGVLIGLSRISSEIFIFQVIGFETVDLLIYL